LASGAENLHFEEREKRRHESSLFYSDTTQLEADGRPLTKFFFQKFLQILEILDLSVHNTVTNISRWMEFQQSGGHPISQNLTAKFAPLALLDSAFDQSHHSVQMPLCYRKFGARLSDSGQYLFPIKSLNAAVAFYHQRKLFL
jgi:hypothetical protein